jgi:hypothetical protein
VCISRPRSKPSKCLREGRRSGPRKRSDLMRAAVLCRFVWPAAVAVTVHAATLTLDSARDYQVFQRSSASAGGIAVRGNSDGPCDTASAHPRPSLATYSGLAALCSRSGRGDWGVARQIVRHWEERFLRSCAKL